jgi:hypothetical protein
MSDEMYNLNYLIATRETNASNERIAKIEGKYDLKVAQEQSRAVIEQAKADLEARRLEANLNHQAQMEALRVRELEAKLQYKVDWKNAQSEAVRADAAFNMSLAAMRDSETKSMKEENRHEERMNRLQMRDYMYDPNQMAA